MATRSHAVRASGSLSNLDQENRAGALPTPSLTVAIVAAPPRDRTLDEVPACIRRDMIEQAAYRRAEQRGFAPGHELEDWLAAEIEVDDTIRARFR